jgi:hypothetical protein
MVPPAPRSRTRVREDQPMPYQIGVSGGTVSRMPDIVAGQQVKWTITFSDVTGTPIRPASATVYLSCAGPERELQDSVAMTVSGSTCTAIWDSSPAQSGMCFWSAQCPGAAIEGHFNIKANPANPNRKDKIDGFIETPLAL